MREWARYNLALLAGHELYATATTGRLVKEQLGLPSDHIASNSSCPALASPCARYTGIMRRYGDDA